MLQVNHTQQLMFASIIIEVIGTPSDIWILEAQALLTQLDYSQFSMSGTQKSA